MMGESPFKAAVELASSGYRNKRDERFAVLEDWQAIGRALPPGAIVLVHDEPMHLGIGARVVSDIFQTGIDYTHHASPDRMFDRLRRLGVTHILGRSGESSKFDSVGGEVAWSYFFKRHGVRPRRYGAFTLARMPEERPDAADFRDRVLFLGCEDTYASGLYRFEDLDVPMKMGELVELPPYREPLRRLSRGDDVEPLYAEVDAIVHDPECFPAPEVASSRFIHILDREHHRIWIRKQ
jgi:hypothetical protein